MIGVSQTQRRPLRELTVRIAPAYRRNPKEHAASVQAQIQSARRLRLGNRKAEGCGPNAVAKKLSFAGNPAAAVAFAGRALPAAWRRCPNEDLPMALVEMIIETLGWGRDAINALGGDRKAIAVADMGNPQRAQTDRGDRARGDVLLMEDGEVAPFDELADAPGMSWRRRARAFKKSGLIERWAARSTPLRLGLDLLRHCMKRGAAHLARRRFQPI